MANPLDEAELWWLDTPFGCGGVYTIGGQIVRGGAPIFNRLTGYHIDKLPPSHKYEYIGVEPFESRSRKRSG
jgi:hypothetical protein